MARDRLAAVGIRLCDFFHVRTKRIANAYSEEFALTTREILTPVAFDVRRVAQTVGSLNRVGPRPRPSCNTCTYYAYYNRIKTGSDGRVLFDRIRIAHATETDIVFRGDVPAYGTRGRRRVCARLVVVPRRKRAVRSKSPCTLRVDGYRSCL